MNRSSCQENHAGGSGLRSWSPSRAPARNQILLARIGLYSIGVEVPAGAPVGDAIPVALTINGIAAHAVTIAVQWHCGHRQRHRARVDSKRNAPRIVHPRRRAEWRLRGGVYAADAGTAA